MLSKADEAVCINSPTSRSVVHNLRKEAVMSTRQQLPFLTTLVDPTENICPGLTKSPQRNQNLYFIEWVYRWKTDYTKKENCKCLPFHPCHLLWPCEQSFHHILQGGHHTWMHYFMSGRTENSSRVKKSLQSNSSHSSQSITQLIWSYLYTNSNAAAAVQPPQQSTQNITEKLS